MKFVSKSMLAVMLVCIMILMTMVVAFADDGGASSVIDFSSIFNENIFEPLVEGITSNLWVLLPVSLGLFAIFLGVRIIPYLLNRFSYSQYMKSTCGDSFLDAWKEYGRDYGGFFDWK